MGLGRRIKELRTTVRLTQSEFAEKLGVSKRAVQEWEAERRTPSEPVLRQIEQTFSVNPEWLRHGKGEMFLKKVNEEEEVLFEFFEALESSLGMKIPRAVKRAVSRMYEMQDMKGVLEVLTDYLQEIEEVREQKEIPPKKGNFKGNYSNTSFFNIQSYKEGKDES